MFQVVAGRLLAAALPAAALLCCPAPASAQPPVSQAPPQPQTQPTPQPAVPDPSAPLDPMPDIGVPWPDLQQPDAGKPIAPAPEAGIADAVSERRYTVEISGLDPATEEAIRPQFNELSTLEQKRKESANAAQIDRRAREDADLLVELLRSRGYYDAAVEAEVAAAPAAGGDVRVTLAAEPGALYHFTSVALPGIEQAGVEADMLRSAFAVRPSDPVDADKVNQAQQALQVEL